MTSPPEEAESGPPPGDSKEAVDAEDGKLHFPYSAFEPVNRAEVKCQQIWIIFSNFFV